MATNAKSGTWVRGVDKSAKAPAWQCNGVSVATLEAGAFPDGTRALVRIVEPERSANVRWTAAAGEWTAPGRKPVKSFDAKAFDDGMVAQVAVPAPPKVEPQPEAVTADAKPAPRPRPATPTDGGPPA